MHFCLLEPHCFNEQASSPAQRPPAFPGAGMDGSSAGFPCKHGFAIFLILFRPTPFKRELGLQSYLRIDIGERPQGYN